MILKHLKLCTIDSSGNINMLFIVAKLHYPSYNTPTLSEQFSSLKWIDHYQSKAALVTLVITNGTFACSMHRNVTSWLIKQSLWCPCSSSDRLSKNERNVSLLIEKTCLVKPQFLRQLFTFYISLNYSVWFKIETCFRKNYSYTCKCLFFTAVAFREHILVFVFLSIVVKVWLPDSYNAHILKMLNYLRRKKSCLIRDYARYPPPHAHPFISQALARKYFVSLMPSAIYWHGLILIHSRNQPALEYTNHTHASPFPPFPSCL